MSAADPLDSLRWVAARVRLASDGGHVRDTWLADEIALMVSRYGEPSHYTDGSEVWTITDTYRRLNLPPGHGTARDIA